MSSKRKSSKNRIHALTLLILQSVLFGQSASADEGSRYVAHASISKRQISDLTQSAAEFKRTRKQKSVRLVLPSTSGVETVELVPSDSSTKQSVKAYVMTEQGPQEDPNVMTFFKRKGSGKDFTNLALITNRKTGSKSVRGFMRRKGTIYSISPTADLQLGEMRYASASKRADAAIELAVSELNNSETQAAFSSCGVNPSEHLHEESQLPSLFSGDYVAAALQNRPTVMMTISTDADFEYYSMNGVGNQANTIIRTIIETLVAPVYEQQLNIKLSILSQYAWSSRSAAGYPFGTGKANLEEVKAAWLARFDSDPTAWVERRPSFRVLFTARALRESTMVGDSDWFAFCGGGTIVKMRSDGTNPRPNNQVANTLAHEMGHVIGMQHINSGAAGIMGPYVSTSMTFESQSKSQMETFLEQNFADLQNQATQCLRAAGVNYVSLRGRVTKKSNGQGVAGLSVYFGDGTGVSSVNTDASGYYSIFNVPAGRAYELKISEANGFAPNVYPPYTKGSQITGTFSAPKSGVLNSNSVIDFVIHDTASNPTPPDPESSSTLTIKSGTFKPSTKTPRVGRKIGFSAIVINKGTSVASGITVTLKVNGQNITPNKTRASLAPNRTFAASWSGSWMAGSAGSRSATVCVKAQSLGNAESCSTINFLVTQ